MNNWHLDKKFYHWLGKCSTCLWAQHLSASGTPICKHNGSPTSFSWQTLNDAQRHLDVKVNGFWCIWNLTNIWTPKVAKFKFQEWWWQYWNLNHKTRQLSKAQHYPPNCCTNVMSWKVVIWCYNWPKWPYKYMPIMIRHDTMTLLLIFWWNMTLDLINSTSKDINDYFHDP